MFVKRFAQKTTLVLALALTATVAYGQTYTVESGKTTVALSTDFVSALSTLHVTPGTIGPTVLSGGKVNFPVVAGAFDINNAKGEILHSGGLPLANASTRVRLHGKNTAPLEQNGSVESMVIDGGFSMITMAGIND